MRLSNGAKTWLAIVVLFILMAIGGTADHTEAVIQTIPEDVYHAIRKEIGANASEYRIARYYLKNKDRYAE